LLTDVDAVGERWPDPAARRIASVSPAALQAIAFEAGSMGPKAAAAAFAHRTGRRAAIGSLDDAAAVLAGRADTQVRQDAPLTFRDA
jgi:carbamate kinase